MGLLDRLRGPQPVTEATVPISEHAAVVNQLEVLTDTVAESLAGIEQLTREDIGWRKLGMEIEQSFTRPGLLTIHAACLAAYIKSPLIGRGVRIRRNYVWGGGCEIAARDATSDGGHEVNDLIQALVDSPEFQRTLGSAQAREERETNLGTAGEFFLLAVHDTAARTVRPRLVPAAQISDYIANPEDLTEVWFYKREWTTRRVDLATNALQVVRRVEWHPTLDYRPALRDRLDLIAGQPVRWDQPIQHCAVNSVTDAPWGVPDVYAAIDWARAYADYLSAWAGLMKALARYAFKATAPAKHTAKVKAALANGAAPDPMTGQPKEQQVGGTAVMPDSAGMAPMHSSGATIDANSGKPLAGMAAAALDVPITMLLADPGVTGARATAETLDRPLELTTGSRQNLWVDWLKALFTHVITVAVDDQVLAGSIVQDPTRQLAVLPDDLDGTVDVTFPPIEDVPLKDRLEAIGLASDLPIPRQLIVRLGLEALGVEDVDEVLADMTDERGNFVDPRVTAAVDRFQREQDAAAGSQAAEAYA